MAVRSVATLALLLGGSSPLVAQPSSPAAASASPAASVNPPASRVPAAAVDAPPEPVAPAVITRDDRGQATLRATRLQRHLVVDGRLDEEVYQEVPAAGGFIQSLPVEGDPATEATSVWVFFDDTNLYVAARCWDSHPERMIANELRRDNSQAINGNEGFSISIDTFLDRRNGYSFQTNEPRLEFNWVTLPYGQFTTMLAANRVTITPTPRMAIISLMQFNRSQRSLSTSARLRWEYSPNSHFFVVYTDGRDTLTPGLPDLLSRSFAVKVTRLMRF